MKHLGYEGAGCQCEYCIGPNGGSKGHKKALKKKGRQKIKKELKASLENTDDQASQS